MANEQVEPVRIIPKNPPASRTAVAPAPNPRTTALCQECGDSIEWNGKGARPRYCVDHKPSPLKERVITPAVKVSPTSNNAKVTKVVAKILVIITVIMAARRVGKYNIVDEQLEDALALTEQEAEAVAKPIARWASNSNVGNKMITPIVENEDLLEAGVALWEYNRRVSRLMAQYVASIPRTNNIRENIQNVTTGQDATDRRPFQVVGPVGPTFGAQIV